MSFMRPSDEINAMESGDGVFFIQNERIWSFSKTKSIPVPSGICRRSIKPRFRSASVRATSAETTMLVPSAFMIVNSCVSNFEEAQEIKMRAVKTAKSVQNGRGETVRVQNVVCAVIFYSPSKNISRVISLPEGEMSDLFCKSSKTFWLTYLSVSGRSRLIV